MEGHSQGLRTEAFSVPSAWLRARALPGGETPLLYNALGQQGDSIHQNVAGQGADVHLREALDECCEVLCPQLLDVALRTTQESIDVETVGVGTDLRRDPGDQPHEGGCQRLPETQLALEARQRYLHLLPLAALPEAFGHQQDA